MLNDVLLDFFTTDVQQQQTYNKNQWRNRKIIALIVPRVNFAKKLIISGT